MEYLTNHDLFWVNQIVTGTVNTFQYFALEAACAGQYAYGTSTDVPAQAATLLARLLDKSPAAIRRGLYTMKKIEAMGFEESMSFTESQIALFTLTEDAKEGQQAFQQKRKPEWKGQ